MLSKKLAAVFLLSTQLATLPAPLLAEPVDMTVPNNVLLNDPSRTILSDPTLLPIRPGKVMQDIMDYAKELGLEDDLIRTRAELRAALRANPLRQDRKWRAALDNMATGTDVLLIGDPDHTRTHLLNFALGHRDTLEMMKTQGISHVYLEMNKGFDRYIDAYYKNRITFQELGDVALWWQAENHSWNSWVGWPEQLKQLSLRLNFIKEAKEMGIRVHAGDNMKAERLHAHDKDLAHLIASTAQGGRAVVIYGAYHGNVWINDLDDQLANYGLRSRMLNLDSKRKGEMSIPETWRASKGISDVSETFFDVDKRRLYHTDVNGDGKITNGKMPPQDLIDAAQRRYKPRS